MAVDLPADWLGRSEWSMTGWWLSAERHCSAQAQEMMEIPDFY
jgi:hypothetical protein